MKKIKFFSLLSCSVLATISTYGQVNTNMRLLHKYSIIGDGKWDYLLADPASNNLYVSHGTLVNILNKKNGDVLGTIPNTLGVHGIALVADLKKGYTSNGKTGDCTVFNTSTNQEIGRIKAGENPDAIFYDDFSKKIFVFNGRSLDATVIDPVSDQVITTIALGGKPETGVSDGKGKIYVNIEDTNEVVCIDASTLKVLKRYSLKEGEEPSGLAIDRKNAHLFVGCANKAMIILDANTGKMISKLPIGEGCDGVVFDPDLMQAYSSNGEGNVTVVKSLKGNQFKVVQTVKTIPGARTVTVDKTSHHIFLSVGDKSSKPETFRVLEYGI